MNFLKKLLIHIPDQTISFTMLIGMIYLICRGAIISWEDPPNLKYVMGVILIGSGLGVLRALTDGKMNVGEDR